MNGDTLKRYGVGLILALAACAGSSEANPVHPSPGAPPSSGAAAAAPELSEKESAALDAALAWLALIDQQKFAETWGQASSRFRAGVEQDTWVQQLQSGVSELGAVEKRQVGNVEYSDSLPNAPAGEYVVMQFESNFAGAGKLTETVTAFLEPDGVWRVLGYFIKP